MDSLNLPSIAAKLTSGMWLISEDVHAHMCQQIAALVNADLEDIVERILAQEEQPKIKPTTGDDISTDDDDGSDYTAIIPVKGVIMKDPDLVSRLLLGATDVDEISAMIDDAANDPSVKSIILQFASPGGEMTGVEELARKISVTDGTIKPVFAWTENNPGICSAAYFLASQCRQIGSTPSALVGAVGCFVLGVNEKARLEKEGIEIIPFVSGKYKAITHSWHKLSDDEKKILQSNVDRIGKQFVDTVLKKRPDISEEDIEGLSYLGQEALSKRYVDVLADSFEEYIQTLNNNDESSTNTNNDMKKVKLDTNKKSPTTTIEASASDITKTAADIKMAVITADVTGGTPVADAPIIPIKAEEEEAEANSIPGLPGVETSEEEDNTMACPNCKGTGKVSKTAQGEEEEEEEEEEENRSDEVSMKPVAKTTLGKLTAEEFHSIFGSTRQPSVSEDAKAFHKLFHVGH
jgi:signal peptide peptidase SppA